MRRRERGGRSVADQLLREGRTSRSPNPVLVLWRWRWELGLVAVVAVLVRNVAPGLLLAAAAVVVALCAVVPALRPVRRFWCVATQHRLRAGLRESDVRSWGGSMPAIVWTSAIDDGERVLLAGPAGVDIGRIAAARGELASACWALDVAVHPHDKHANLVVVEVVRRREQP